MQKLLCLLSFITLISFWSCKEEKPTPKVIYEESKPKITETKKIDTTAIKIADLPILMEETQYLIHPVGDIRIYENTRYSRSTSYGSSKVNNFSYAISNYNPFEITGYLDNLKFQHIDSTSVYSLTDKKMQIYTVTYLQSIASKINRKILLYSLADSDTNRDGKIDQNDIKSLYLSNINGTNFLKLTEDYNEVIDWNVVEKLNRLYFRCIEDINKNGAFDKKDKVHYHFINLANDEWKAEEYFPI